MMKFRTIKYYIKEGLKGLFKNALMSLASIAIISACVFIVVISYCISVNISFNMKELENTFGITVFPEDDYTSAGKLNSLLNDINNVEHIIEVKHITPDEALGEFKEDLGEMSDVLIGLEDDNPLSDSFEIKIDEAVNQGEVISALELVDGVRKVKHAQKETEILVSMSNGLHIVSLSLILLLCVVAVLIVMNTIKLTMHSRRHEINIMKYVGSTDWFIRWPFIIEGMFIGLFGALIPVLISWSGYDKLLEMLSARIAVLTSVITFLSASRIFPDILPITILIGALLGIIGSLTSVSKYLKV